MRPSTVHHFAAASLCLVCLATGCNPPSVDESADGTEPAAAASVPTGHSHSHDEPGPHGGHVLDTLPSGVHIEWTHDDANQSVTVYLEDFDADKLVGAKFVVKSTESKEEFPLQKGDDGWSITSEPLLKHMNSDAEIVVIVTDDAGDHTAAIKHHHLHD